MLSLIWMWGTAVAATGTAECRTAATLVDANGVERVHTEIFRACVLARGGRDPAATAMLGCQLDAVWHDASGFARVDRREVRRCLVGYGIDPRHRRTRSTAGLADSTADRAAGT